MAAEQCYYCNREIPLDQQACVYEGNVACLRCDSILRNNDKALLNDVQTENHSGCQQGGTSRWSLPEIKKAIDNQAELTIIYWAGTQPGCKRRILPVAIDDDKLRAICLETGLIKSFFIHKIDFVTSDTPYAKSYVSGLEDHQEDLSNFDRLSKPVIDQLTADGWHVIMTEDSLGVHLKFKNGIPHKTAEVDLLFFPERGDEITGECHPSVRPWYVRGKKTGQARTFKDLHSALNHFIELANKTKEMIDDRRTLRTLQKAHPK